MVAQQKMKEEEVDKTDGAGSPEKPQPGSPKSRLAMLKRSSAKKNSTAASSDPFRFQGNGVSYKGKLIGTRDVDAARGDAMCADAMRDAKAAVKAAGTHKQRVQLNINIEGIKILEEKSQTVLFNFPVSRISFIARDTTDARAFGFVFGNTDGKYKFYGIKTAQTADHAVLAIRDMFQIVYEMKRKQIEQVKQKQEEEKKKEMEENGIRSENGVLVADLLDLETELQHIEQGVNQLAHIPVVAGDEWPGETSTYSTNGSALDPFGQQPFGMQAAAAAAAAPAAAPRQADPFSDSFLSTPAAAGQAHSFNTSAVATPQLPFAPSATSTPQPFMAGQLSQSPATLYGVQPSAIHHMHQMPYAANGWGQQQQQQQIPYMASQPFAQAAPGFSETNPFASAVAAPPAVDPFDTSAARMTLAGAPIPAFGAAAAPVNWGGAAVNENTAPTFTANFGDASKTNGNSNGGANWDSSRRVSSLEEAFTKLVDIDSLVGQPQTKKNPFEHLINPPKVPLNALGSSSAAASYAPPTSHSQSTAHSTTLAPTSLPPRPAIPAPVPVFPGNKANDPFADDFFN